MALLLLSVETEGNEGLHLGSDFATGFSLPLALANGDSAAPTHKYGMIKNLHFSCGVFNIKFSFVYNIHF